MPRTSWALRTAPLLEVCPSEQSFKLSWHAHPRACSNLNQMFAHIHTGGMSTTFPCSQQAASGPFPNWEGDVVLS